MKRSTTLFLPILLVLALASCGTPAQYSQQRYPDGIYVRPGEEPEVVRLYTEEDFERMAAANIARKQGRDTLVVILDDPWDYAWYNRYDHYYYSPWVWGGLGFGSYYWNRWRFGSWYDPWYYDPWYGGYGYGWYDPWYSGWYDPWYYDPWYGGYGWYGHRYGWYDQPWYPGGGWGVGGRNYANRVYTPRSTTTAGGSRERRPGSGSNYRYGTPGSAGGSVIRGGNTRSVNRSQSGLRSGSSSASSTTRSREQGYNPSRTYTNKNSGGSSSSNSSGSRSSTRSYSSGNNSSYGSGSYNSGSSTRSYSGNSSSGSSRSYGGGGGYSGGGGGGYSGGGSSHSSGGGGSHSGGGRR